MSVGNPVGLHSSEYKKNFVEEISTTIKKNLYKSESSGDLNKLAKWMWFHNYLQSNLRLNSDLLKLK